MEYQTKYKNCRGSFLVDWQKGEKCKKTEGNAGKMIRAEIRRLSGHAELLRTFLSSVVLLLLCAATYFRQHDVSDLNIYDVFEGIFNGGYFTELLMIPLGYVITTNVCMDMKEKVYRFYVARASVRTYIICRYVIDILFPFFMAEAVLQTCFLLGSSFVQPVPEEYMEFIADAYRDLLMLHPVLYYELRMLWISLVTCVFISVGMAVSAAIHNLYVSALSPFLSYVIITRLQLIAGIPSCLSYEVILSGFARTHASAGKSVVWITLYIFISLLVLGLVFYIIMKRSICDEGR